VELPRFPVFSSFALASTNALGISGTRWNASLPFYLLFRIRTLLLYDLKFLRGLPIVPVPGIRLGVGGQAGEPTVEVGSDDTDVVVAGTKDKRICLMPLVINTNVSATHSARLLDVSAARLAKSLARLSSGSRLVSPEDDAAGLAQSIKFDAQINRNVAANSNIQNAVSFSQTQDGFLQKVQKSLDRMSELSVLAQDATKTNSDLSNYQSEFTQLQSYVSDITGKQFNGVSLFDAKGLSIILDKDKERLDAADLTGATSTGVLNAYSGISISTSTAAYSALNQIKTAIQALANMRALVGANIQRLNLTSEQLTILNQNLSAANSRIKDVDVADESTEFAKQNILVQSGTAMLAQANAVPIAALQLLG